MENEKIKVLVLSDHPLSPSGVGTQTKYMIESCLDTGKFKFICLGGAIKHLDYNPVKVEPYGEDFIVVPVDGYGNHEQIRSLLRTHKPDILWFMTDPRFFHWLWEIENEVRSCVPMVYYHVWDNYPYPTFNKEFYDSNDTIACISKVTYDIVKTVSPEVDSHYVPHAVDGNIFKPLEKEEYEDFVEKSLPQLKNKFVFFWNNRNARRKQSGSLIFWFKKFLDQVGNDKAALVMHTDPFDRHGQDLNAIINELGLTNGEVIFSTQPVSADLLAKLYNYADCTINVSDAEGFGLSTLESLTCGTPVIVNMTGGLQEQVTDGNNWFGIGIEPASKAIIGSQQVPYIYEDRISEEDVVNAMLKMYNMSEEEKNKLSKMGLEHVEKNYNFKNFKAAWPKLLNNVHEKFGSWDNRKNYKPWHLLEIK
jgi:glycosyltransferase involved in cell wall biosynthesis